MKIGMILEGRADQRVCEYLAERIRPDIEISSVTLTHKPKLLRNSGEQAALLLAEGCERVLIIWDLYPPWRDVKPCRKEDRDNIFASLKKAGVSLSKVHLICIREELEAWLLADGRALYKVLSEYAHPHRIKIVKDFKKPDRVNKPKTKLRKIFQETLGKDTYNDVTDNEKIVYELPDLERIRRSESFQRFEAKLTAS